MGDIIFETDPWGFIKKIIEFEQAELDKLKALDSGLDQSILEGRQIELHRFSGAVALAERTIEKPLQ